MSDGLPRLMAMAVLCLVLICGGCAPTAQMRRPETGTGSNPGSVALGTFTGPRAEEVRRALAETLTQDGRVRLDDQAAEVLSGKVEAGLEEVQGEDLVRMKKNTGEVKQVTVEDPFVKQPFTYRVPVVESVVESKPFVVRQAWLSLKYSLAQRSGAPVVGPEQTRVATDIKYGGVNENLDSGQALKDLPPAEETVRRLALELARKVQDRLFPDPNAVVVLDDGPGLLGESETSKGVALAQQGQWAEARRIWENILKSDANFPAANFNLGVYWERLGGRDHLERARDYYATAARNGNNPHYREALTRVTVALRDSESRTSD